MVSEAFLTGMGRFTYLSSASVLFLLILAEALWPFLPFERERERVRHVLQNFGLWLITFMVANVGFGIMLLDVQNRLLETQFGVFHWLDTPFALKLVIGILLLDFAEYIFHRLSHSVRGLWLLHAVHHSDPHLNVTTSLRFHPGEIMMNISWKLCVCWILGLPLWFVGARGLIMVVTTLVQHSNVRWPPALDMALRPVFVTPSLHRCHHSADHAENDSNFGEIFSFWDRLFGTYHHVEPDYCPDYGLPKLQEPGWHTVWGLIKTPVAARNLGTL